MRRAVRTLLRVRCRSPEVHQEWPDQAPLDRAQEHQEVAPPRDRHGTIPAPELPEQRIGRWEDKSSVPFQVFASHGSLFKDVEEKRGLSGSGRVFVRSAYSPSPVALRQRTRGGSQVMESTFSHRRSSGRTPSREVRKVITLCTAVGSSRFSGMCEGHLSWLKRPIGSRGVTVK